MDKDQCINISSRKSKINVSAKRKGKEPMHQSSLPHDSDFEDEIPISKRSKIMKRMNSSTLDNPKKSVVNKDKNVSDSPQNKPCKRRTKKLKDDPKNDQKLSRWCSYVNSNVFDEITEFLSKYNMLDLFKSGPFGYLFQLPPLNVQSQFIRALVHHLKNKDHIGEVLVFNFSGKELSFGLREFKAVTGLKCGTVDDYTHDLMGKSKLVERYFPMACAKGVEKYHLISAFKAGLFEMEDVFNIVVIYFISTYILSSPPPPPKKYFVPLDHFLLVESGRYTTYPWGRRSFFDLRDSLVCQLVEDPDYVKFSGFPLALQIWFYECCNKVDPAIAVRKEHRSPRLFNWTTSNNRLFFNKLLRGMFRRYDNQYKFQDFSFTPNDFAAFEVEQLHDVNVVDTNDPHSSDEGNDDVVAWNFKKIVGDLTLVHNDFKALEVKVEAQIGELKTYMDECFKNVLDAIKLIQSGREKNEGIGSQKVS